MTTNSRMASAVHIMSFVAYAGDEGTTSEAIAKSLQTNPGVVRKILKLLEREGLVALCQGRHGGGGLRRPASPVTIVQIYKAVESKTGVFALRSQVHEGCAVACAMKRRLGPIFNAANDAVEQALSKTSLAELVRDVGETLSKTVTDTDMKGKLNMKTKLQLSKNVTMNKSDEKTHGMQVRQVVTGH